MAVTEMKIKLSRNKFKVLSLPLHFKIVSIIMTPDYVTMPQEGQVKVLAKRFSINKSLSLHLGMQVRLLQQTDILSV